ncbi:MAG: hypothetical protein ABI591_24990 [Kofleriaceae bacterium]
MSRHLTLALVLVASPAFADAITPPPTTPVAPPDLSDQAIGVELGAATGGRVTAGGLRIEGHYLYQLSDRDWFDGTADFTFGSNSPGCFRDRSNAVVCDHGLASGDAFEIAAGVRHFFGGDGQFWPFVRGGVGLRFVRFGDDSVSGIAIPLHLGGGVRVSLSPAVALTVQGELELGIGDFSHSLGAEPQLGIAITAGVEFRL